MALIYCKECGKEISNDTPRCPNCGAQTMQGKIQREAIGLLISVVIALVTIIWGLIWFFKYVDPFFEFWDYSPSYRKWLLEYSEDARECIWRFIFGVSFLVGGVIDAFVIKKKVAELNSKERYYTRQAVKDYQSKQSSGRKTGGFEVQSNGEWRCACGRTNSHNTSTCVCGKRKLELAKKAGVTENGRWTCQSCNSQNPPAAKACVRCGAVRPAKVDSTTQAEVSQNAKKFCPECGDECALTAKFCPGCGTILEPINEQND